MVHGLDQHVNVYRLTCQLVHRLAFYAVCELLETVLCCLPLYLSLIYLQRYGKNIGKIRLKYQLLRCDFNTGSSETHKAI